jgi:WD40 repeat protein
VELSELKQIHIQQHYLEGVRLGMSHAGKDDGTLTPRGETFDVFIISPVDRWFRVWLDLRDAMAMDVLGISISVAFDLPSGMGSAFPAFAAFASSAGIQKPLPFTESLRKRKLQGELIESLTHALLNGDAVIHLGNVPEHLFGQVRQAVYHKLYDAKGLSPTAGAVLAAQAGVPQVGHAAPVHTAIFHPDSRRLLTLAGDGRPRVWDAVKGKELYALPDTDDWLEAMFLDGGRSVFTRSYNKFALWDARTGRLHRLTEVAEGIGSAQLSSDGRTVAVWSWGSAPRFQQVDSRGKTIASLELPAMVTSASQDFRYLVVGNYQEPPQIFDSVDKKVVATLPGSFVSFVPGRSHVVTSVESQLRVWRLPAGAAVQNLPGSFDMKWSPRGGEYLTSMPGERRAAVVSAAGRSRFAIPEASLEWGPDGNLLLASHFGGGTSSIYRTRDSSLVFTAGVDELIVSPDGKTAAGFRRKTSADPDEQETWVFHVATGGQLARLKGTCQMFSPDSQRLVLFSNGVPQVYDVGTLRRRSTLGGIRFLDPPEGGAGGGEAGGPEKSERRYADIEYPGSVLAERAFTVSVGLVRKEPELEPEYAHSQLPQPLVLPPGTHITVVLATSADFELQSPSKFELEVLADKDTDPVKFELRAKPGVRGPRELKLIFFQGFEILAQRKIVVTVVASVRAAVPPKRATLWMRGTDLYSEQVAKPDVILYVDRETHEGRDTLAYACEWQQKSWSRTDAGRIEMQVSAEEWLEPHYDRLTAWARKDGSPDELEKLGQNLYSELFSPELKDLFAQFAQSAQTILIYTNEPWIPWELVKPWGKEVPEKAREFLAARFQLSRWYYTEAGQRPRGALPLQVVMPVIPPSDLKAVYLESQYFNGLPLVWPGVNVRRPWPTEPSQVIAAMSDGESQLIHFAAHGSLGSRQPGPALRVGRGYLYAEDLVGDAVAMGVERAAPFVFMNACHSGRQKTGLTRNQGWVERLLEMGASGFLGANWEVDDGMATEFAIGVYDRLRSGMHAGAAVHGARMDLRGARPGNSTWLAYSLWSHPALQVRAAAPVSSSQTGEPAHG